jgi:hypothetical protein
MEMAPGLFGPAFSSVFGAAAVSAFAFSFGTPALELFLGMSRALIRALLLFSPFAPFPCPLPPLLSFPPFEPGSPFGAGSSIVFFAFAA